MGSVIALLFVGIVYGAPLTTIVPNLKITGQAGYGTKCLHINNTGDVSTSSADCGTGGGGTPAGLDTYVQFNDTGAFGGVSNFTFTSSTGELNVPIVRGVGASFTRMDLNYNGNGGLNVQAFSPASGDAGDIIWNAGNSLDLSGSGGNLVFNAGNGLTEGNISLNPGVNASGTPGKVFIGTPFYTKLDPILLTAVRLQQFPDADGVFVLGTGVAGKCAQWTATSTLTAASGACGSGGSGATTTITAGGTANGPALTFATSGPAIVSINCSGSTCTFTNSSSSLNLGVFLTSYTTTTPSSPIGGLQFNENNLFTATTSLTFSTSTKTLSLFGITSSTEIRSPSSTISVLHVNQLYDSGATSTQCETADPITGLLSSGNCVVSFSGLTGIVSVATSGVGISYTTSTGNFALSWTNPGYITSSAATTTLIAGSTATGPALTLATSGPMLSLNCTASTCTFTMSSSSLNLGAFLTAVPDPLTIANLTASTQFNSPSSSITSLTFGNATSTGILSMVGGTVSSSKLFFTNASGSGIFTMQGGSVSSSALTFTNATGSANLQTNTFTVLATSSLIGKSSFGTSTAPAAGVQEYHTGNGTSSIMVFGATSPFSPGCVGIVSSSTLTNWLAVWYDFAAQTSTIHMATSSSATSPACPFQYQNP